MNYNKIILKQKNQFIDFCDNINTKNVNYLVQTFMSYKFKNIFMMGIGKSGHISKLVCDILKSVGFKTIFLECEDLLHGNLGIIDRESLIIMITKSGNTKELNDIHIHLLKRKCNVVCVNMNLNGKLKQKVKKYITIPYTDELESKFNKVPS